MALNRTYDPKRMNSAATHELFQRSGELGFLIVGTGAAGSLSIQYQDATVICVIDTTTARAFELHLRSDNGIQIVQAGAADCLALYAAER